MIPARPSRSGFTLIELLVVLAIMALLGAAISQGMRNRPAAQVSTAAAAVIENLFLARQTAVAQNRPVEIWFVRPAGGGFFEAFQIFMVDDAGVPRPQARLQALPATVGIDSEAALSPLMASGRARTWPSGGAPTLSTYRTQYDCRYVRFLPDGSTDLPTSQDWFLTIHDRAVPDRQSRLPANYALIKVDPLTGRATLFRP